MSPLAIILVSVAAVAAALAVAVRLAIRGRGPVVARAAIVSAEDHTSTAPSGAVRSVQSADLTLPATALDAIWSPLHLERLARTYWRFLTRCTLGLVRVSYGEDVRRIVLIARPLTLLRFGRPEYELDADRGVVRWRIERGLLVSRRGHGGDGELRIDIERRAAPTPGDAVAHVTLTVSNFYPAIAAGLSRWVYANTQSRIHVIVTHGFLRSLERLDLARSRVGRFEPPAGPSLTPGDR